MQHLCRQIRCSRTRKKTAKLFIIKASAETRALRDGLAGGSWRGQFLNANSGARVSRDRKLERLAVESGGGGARLKSPGYANRKLLQRERVRVHAKTRQFNAARDPRLFQRLFQFLRLRRGLGFLSSPSLRPPPPLLFLLPPRFFAREKRSDGSVSFNRPGLFRAGEASFLKPFSATDTSSLFAGVKNNSKLVDGAPR